MLQKRVVDGATHASEARCVLRSNKWSLIETSDRAGFLRPHSRWRCDFRANQSSQQGKLVSGRPAQLRDSVTQERRFGGVQLKGKTAAAPVVGASGKRREWRIETDERLSIVIGRGAG